VVVLGQRKFAAGKTRQGCHSDPALREKNPGICRIKQIQRSFVAPQGGAPQDDMLGGFFRSLLGAGAADATACSCCAADAR